MKTKQDLLTLGGAIAGAVVGYFVFIWLTGYGYYAFVLPGGLAGLGGGILKTKSLMMAVLCGVAGLVAGVYTRWRVAFGGPSLGEFLSHVGNLGAPTLLMIAAGTFIAFWLPWDRTQKAV